MKLVLPNQELTLPDSKGAAARYLADILLNRGRVEDEGIDVSWNDMAYALSPRNREQVLKDEVTSTDIRPLLSETLEVIVREPVEPLMNILPLFNRVEVQGLQSQIIAGAVGSFVADDVIEGGTYPEVMFQVGGGLQTVTIGKSGIQASFTDEALRYSSWDIYSMVFRKMGQALTRHKEFKASAFLRAVGTPLFDNRNPTGSVLGVLTGRGINGQANGSLIMDDLLKGMAHMDEEGFHPDTLVMNPQFFYLYLVDPVLRSMMLAHGGGSYFQQWNGVAGPRDPWSRGAVGRRGDSSGQRIVPGGAANGATATGMAGREHGMTSAPPVPSPYFPWPFNVVVSHQIPFDAESETGDILLISSSSVGDYLVDQEPTSVTWRDESVDKSSVKILERYSFNVVDQGQGVGLIKNVPLRRNYWDGTIGAHTLDIDTEVDPTTPIDL